MSDGIKALDLSSNEAKRMTVGQNTKEQEQAPETSQKQISVQWEQLQTFRQLLEDSGLAIPNKLNYDIVEQVSVFASEQIIAWYEQYTKQKEQCQTLRAELKKMREVYGKLPKDKKQGGRKRKAIDWARYDLLKQAGMSEQDIAKYMHIGASTLRRYKAER